MAFLKLYTRFKYVKKIGKRGFKSLSDAQDQGNLPTLPRQEQEKIIAPFCLYQTQLRLELLIRMAYASQSLRAAHLFVCLSRDIIYPICEMSTTSGNCSEILLESLLFRD